MLDYPCLSVPHPAFQCSVNTCPEIATVVVEHRDSSEMPLCGEHWQRAQSAAPVPLQTVRILARPACFVGACEAEAIEIVEHLDGTLLPCCETHLDDLSWVTPERFRASER